MKVTHSLTPVQLEVVRANSVNAQQYGKMARQAEKERDEADARRMEFEKAAEFSESFVKQFLAYVLKEAGLKGHYDLSPDGASLVGEEPDPGKKDPPEKIVSPPKPEKTEEE